ncbi:pilus assembly protein [Desulfurobacterium sp.]
MKRLFLFSVFSLLVVVLSTSVFAATLNPYTAIPPFVQQSSFANLMLVLDYSGSMNFPAYQGESYNASKIYFGYFKPDKKYDFKIIYVPGIGYCGYFYESPDGESGNYLNWEYMARIDILRLILTGGAEYTIKVDGKKQNAVFCDGHFSFIPSSQTIAYNSETGHVEGILQKIQRLRKRPRIGCEIYAYTGKIVKKWVYPSYNYSKVIHNINKVDAYGGTPTGEALDEVRRYFSLKNGVWKGGFKKSNMGYVNPYKFKVDGKKIDVRCTKNYILLISDGAWNGHRGSNNKKMYCETWLGARVVKDPLAAGIKYACAVDPVVPAYEMWKGGKADLNPLLKGDQNVKVYTVSAFITSKKIGALYGLNALKNVAIFGGYKGLADFPGGYDSAPPSPVCSVDTSPPCGSFNIPPDPTYPDWDSNGDGRPDDYYPGNNPVALKNAIEDIFASILKDAFSGTSVGVLPSKKSGVVAEQTLFYPKKTFSGNNVDWPGYLFTWWFLNRKTAQNVREDTNGNKILDIKDDYILNWNVNPDTGKVSIELYNSTLSGMPDKKVATYESFDDLHPVWEAGQNLAFEPPDDRVIYTNVDGSLIAFNDFNKDLLDEYFGNLKTVPCLKEDPGNLIDFIRGENIKGCRTRSIDDTGDTWKLGDIIYSTPAIVKYPSFNVIYVGANDGMLHAFRLGYVKDQDSALHPIKLVDSVNSTNSDFLGEELWAFIPSNVLPYLKYLADPYYQHTYYVDLQPFVVNVNNKVVLIGGMRFGGVPGNGTSLKPPYNDKNVGYSSYFALDVTDPDHPALLWEFTDKNLGFTYSGPAVIDKGSKKYVMFASGPTDYNGDAGRGLYVYVLDLLTGKIVRKQEVISGNAFAGRLFETGVDLDNDGKTDYVFFGYGIKVSNIMDWKGGIVSCDVRSDNPDKWKFRTYFKNKIPPITSRVVAGKYFGRYYVFFGTGRWFYREDNVNPKQPNILFGVPIVYNSTTNEYQLSGVLKNVTYSSKSVCETSSKYPEGWYIELNDSDKGYLKERLISDPTITDQNVVIFVTTEPTADVCGFGGRSRIWILNGATGGSIFDNCTEYQIDSEKLKGTLLVQFSTSAIYKVKLNSASSSFDNATKKRTVKSPMGSEWFTGIAPEGGARVVPPSGGKGELLLWLEK